MLARLGEGMDAMVRRLQAQTEADAASSAARQAEAAEQMRQHAHPEATVHVGLSLTSACFRDLHADERLLALLAPLMPEGVMFLSDKAVFKSGGKRFATPWHVDAAYWAGTRPKLSLWLALDEARTDNGCLTEVRGSHRRHFAHGRAGGIETNGEFPNVIADHGWDARDELACPLGIGGAIVFGDRLVHGSTANVAGADRWSAILTYQAPGPDEPFDLGFPARRVVKEAAMADPSMLSHRRPG
jgi:ectoine hydroxylase-related dioxygenase (phytanoyl-CoA dioxygenase family)